MRLTPVIGGFALVFATGFTAGESRAQELRESVGMEVTATDERAGEPAELDDVIVTSAGEEAPATPATLAQAGQPSDATKGPAPEAAKGPAKDPAKDAEKADEEGADIEEYDPWQPFNEKMFDINLKLDKYLLKPVAKAYDKVVPDQVQRSIRNAFDNINSVKRIVNSVAQGRFETAGQELGRFVFNSVFGVGGLFDVAKSELGIESKSIDAGQTLGVYGAPPGPYLVIPLFPPFTVREAVGYVADSFLNPLRYIGMDFLTSIAVEAEKTINDRSLNLETFEELQKGVFDLYTAVRNGFLQRRQRMVEEGREESVFFGGKKKER